MYKHRQLKLGLLLGELVYFTVHAFDKGPKLPTLCVPDFYHSQFKLTGKVTAGLLKQHWVPFQGRFAKSSYATCKVAQLVLDCIESETVDSTQKSFQYNKKVYLKICSVGFLVGFMQVLYV